jgi:alpha-tubulin suppressor-like RCC1 family protein
MPNQFLSDEFGDIEDYFVTDYWLIDQFVGDQLFTWGAGFGGRLGNNSDSGGGSAVPITTFAGGTNWKQVSQANENGSAIKTDGSLWVWGGNDGTLGTNDTPNRSTPVTTFAGGTNWKSVSNRGNFIAAIKTDGSLWTWGLNTSGQLGDNTTTSRSTPVTTFAGGNNWKQFSCGRDHTAAIKTDGSLWGWGRNEFGRLGINLGNVNRVTPVTTFAGGNNWKQVSAGYYHTAAIKTDGSLWIWGVNNPFGTPSGQLGTNDIVDRSTPVTTFAGGNNWKQVACGYRHTAAIKTDGTLWTWGSNVGGGLGDFSTTNRSTPVTTFAGGNNWKQVSCGRANTAAIKTDGSLWTWGEGSSNSLGSSGANNRSTPITTFAGGTNWKQVTISHTTAGAIKSGLNVDLS